MCSNVLLKVLIIPIEGLVIKTSLVVPLHYMSILAQKIKVLYPNNYFILQLNDSTNVAFNLNCTLLYKNVSKRQILQVQKNISITKAINQLHNYNITKLELGFINLIVERSLTICLLEKRYKKFELVKFKPQILVNLLF